MKICFHVNNLSIRGTTTAIIDYGTYNETLLNNTSIIAYHKNLLDELRDENFVMREEVAKMFKDKFDVIEYTDKGNLLNELKKRECEYIHYLKAGFKDDDFLFGVKNLIQCVFSHLEPHGHKYCYISEWLSNEASGGEYPFVPHIVTLPTEQTENWRLKLGIPNDKIVVGRHGGFHQFSIPFVKDIINFVAHSDEKFRFVFVNTEKFTDHPNVIFCDPIISPQDKTNFILASDAMIHARPDGESFGLSIAEGLFHNKPVFTCGLGRDKNNIELVKGYDLCYNNQYELLDMIFRLKYGHHKYQYNYAVKEFSPENVMKKFEEVFLNE
jgi:hypothetical protein